MRDGILRESHDLRNSVLCAVLMLGAIASTVPIAESGVNDDWSYTKTALDLAETGQLIYRGWTAAMLGAQAYWGALFIKLFGFSFLVVRLSVAPLAVGCAVLLYVLHRQAGLPPGLAVFGTLTLVLSPLFIPHAASFMTEVPALFLLLTSVYGYVQAAHVLDAAADQRVPAAPWHRLLWGWLSFALVAGLLSGTVRQNNWIMPVVGPALLLARRQTFRRLRPAVLPLAASALTALAAALLLSAWFADQPYVVRDQLSSGLSRLFRQRTALAGGRSSIRIALTVGALTFPMIVVVLPLLYRQWLLVWRGPRLIMCAAVLLTLSLWALVSEGLHFRQGFPWLGNTFGIYPYLTASAPAPHGTVVPGLPRLFGLGFGICIMVLLSAGLALWISAILWHPARPMQGAAPSRMPVALGLFGLYCAVYLPLLVVIALIPRSFGVWDRYLLPVLPAVTMGGLTIFHRWTGRESLPRAGWVVLAVFAAYGVAQTHDYFAQLRARVAATDYLEQRGIPRTRILAGFEYDAWTQLTVAGHYNDPRIQKPPGSYVRPPPIGFATIYLLWEHAPAVRPDYVVALGSHPDLTDTDVPAIAYHCWLPPFLRRVVVQVSDPANRAVASLPVQPRPIPPPPHAPCANSTISSPTGAAKLSACSTALTTRRSTSLYQP